MSDGEESAAQPARMIRWLMLAVLVWGLLMALGTFLFGRNQPLLRAAIVVACTLAFLGLWAGALAAQRRK